jgi:glyoxylase-like metal-dependent hydrolase (beta-lactamase superfamily II)
VLLVMVAWVLAQALPASAQPALLRAAAVAPGVWALVGPISGPSRDNHALNATYGVVATPEGTILIDSGASAQGAKLLAAMAQQLTGQPLRWVINTGSQHHRWLGNDQLRQGGAQVIAHRRTVQTQGAGAAAQMVELKAMLGDRLDDTRPFHAERLVDGARSELNLGGQRIEMLDFGDAHFPGDTVVWLPALGVAFTGDLVYVERLLSLAPASNGPSWLAAFERLVSLAPAHVVPGHGGPTNLSTAQAQTGAYLRFVINGVARHARDMAGVEAALAELGDAPAFAGLANYAQLHRSNVNRAYLRAEAGN